MTEYRKPTFGEWLGHVFVGHSEDNYSHLAFTIVGAGLGACAGMVFGPLALRELQTGNLKDFFAVLIVMSPSLIPLAIQTWLLGTENWSPEYREKNLAYQKSLGDGPIPPV